MIETNATFNELGQLNAGIYILDSFKEHISTEPEACISTKSFSDAHNEDPLVDISLALNINLYPRYKRTSEGNIIMIDRKYTSR